MLVAQTSRINIHVDIGASWEPEIRFHTLPIFRRPEGISLVRTCTYSS